MTSTIISPEAARHEEARHEDEDAPQTPGYVPNPLEQLTNGRNTAM